MPTENIFKGFWPRLVGLGEVKMNWAQGKAVTHLRFIPESGGAAIDHPVSVTDAEAGVSSITDLPNDTYRVEIYNDEIVRVATTVKVTGNRFLGAG